MVSIPLFYIAVKTGKKNYDLEKDVNKIKRKYNHLSDVLTNREYAEERKLFDYSSLIRKKFNQLSDKSYKIEAKIEMKKYINMKSGSMVTIVIAVIIMAILLPSLNSGNMSLGTYVALVSAIFNLVQSMSWLLSSAMHEHARLKEYIKDFSVFKNLSEKEDACILPSDMSRFVFESLEFRNVSFKYPGTERYMLKYTLSILHPKDWAQVVA